MCHALLGNAAIVGCIRQTCADGARKTCHGFGFGRVSFKAKSSQYVDKGLSCRFKPNGVLCSKERVISIEEGEALSIGLSHTVGSSVSVIVHLEGKPVSDSCVHVNVKANAGKDTPLSLASFGVESWSMVSTLSGHNALLFPKVSEKANGVGTDPVAFKNG
jgi:hypothetical protein